MNITHIKERITQTRILFLIIIGIAIYLRMINIISEQLWHDEGGTILYVNSTWQHLYVKVVEEKNPILYYTILKLWYHLFGDSVFSLRLLSVIFSILIVPVLFLLGKEVRDEKLGLILSFLFAISPFSIWYANEIRMYSFLQLLFTIDFYFAIKILKSPNITKNYIYFSLTSVCLIYTHYMGVVYLIVLSLEIFLYNRKYELFWKNSLISIIIIISGYIPWIPHAIIDVLEGPTAYTGGTLNLVNLSYWAFYIFVAPVPSFVHIPYVVDMIILTFIINLPLLVLSSIAIIGFLYSYKNKEYFNLKIIINFTIISIILIFGLQILIGFLIVNTFQAKNLIGGLTPIYLIEAFGLYYLIFDKGSSFNQNLKKFLRIFNPRTLRKLFYPLIIIVLI
ncbi:MAG: glycosyltransferase family 39 protein, partial [Promethearchaeota archaeon]